MKGGTLFSGGGGFDLGMIAAGVDHAWGVEYDDKIAQVARDNGLNTITADILQCNPADFEPVDFLHASPPCPNFSNAKTNAEETENDKALAAKVCEFITELLPRVFTLENVYQYRNSNSWETIALTLLTHGYQVNYWHVNMADYGVPQTRKRMIAIARRDGRTPMLPPATHDEKPQAQLFGGRQRWVSWYEAIEDLIPTLPGSEFAPWQPLQLPDELKTGIVMSGNNNFEDAKPGRGFHEQNKPTATVTAQLTGGWPRAVIIDSKNTNQEYGKLHRTEQEPALTVVTDHKESHRPRAFVCAQGKYGDSIPVYDQSEPNGTVTANSNQMGIKAFAPFMLQSGNSSREMTRHEVNEPVATITVSANKEPRRAAINGRIVKMTPHALARFQSFPDDYTLPDNNALACRIIGNAVPPLFAQRLVEWLVK